MTIRPPFKSMFIDRARPSAACERKAYMMHGEAGVGTAGGRDPSNKEGGADNKLSKPADRTLTSIINTISPRRHSRTGSLVKG
jgi:hypothetical protein